MMARNSKNNSFQKIPSKAWQWMLLLPLAAVMDVPFYNKIEPTLWDFPFFYWYQFLWVLISALITVFVYVKTKARPIGAPSAAALDKAVTREVEVSQ
jgi:hypothetical protein